MLTLRSLARPQWPSSLFELATAADKRLKPLALTLNFRNARHVPGRSSCHSFQIGPCQKLRLVRYHSRTAKSIDWEQFIDSAGERVQTAQEIGLHDNIEIVRIQCPRPHLGKRQAFESIDAEQVSTQELR
jgi:hypothetical protein